VAHALPLLIPSDCQACGVCCFSTLDTYIRVTGDDYERLGDRAGEIVHFVENRAYLRMTNGHCAALAAEKGRRLRCTIYDLRPDVCRDLARGSPQCAGELDTKGDRTRAFMRSREP
jgi:hypothetical protein